MRIRGWQIGAFAVALVLVVLVGKGGRSGPVPTVQSVSADVVNLVPTPAPAADPQPRNIILISIDTLRADHMGLYGYHRPTTPNIDRFARGALVFDRAYAAAPFTSPSIVSMLTGLYPYHHGVRLLWQQVDPDLVTLPDLLRAAGYQTAAVVSNIVLGNEAIGLGSRFDHYDEQMHDSTWHRPEMRERRAEATTDAAVAWLGTGRDPQRPFFLWVHYIDPHCPYNPPPDKPVAFTHDTPQPVQPRRIPPSVREPDILDGLFYVDRYDEEIAYTDAQVRRLLDALGDMDLLDSGLTIITADHGEQMIDGNTSFFSHGFDVRDAVVHIPLILRGPGLRARRESQPVSICDITPTVLAAAGADCPAGLDGRCLSADISPRPPYVEGPDSGGSGGLQRAFVYPDRKVIVQHGRSNVPRRAWAYDLANDPAERCPLPVDKAEPAYRILVRMILDDPNPGGVPEKYRHGKRPSALVAGGADAEAVTRLRALGYIE